jgi:hypothetical protein
VTALEGVRTLAERPARRSFTRAAAGVLETPETIWTRRGGGGGIAARFCSFWRLLEQAGESARTARNLSLSGSQKELFLRLKT